METLDKNWYVEIGETVYEATTETVDQWIWDGTVLSQHRVSRGGQRWLEAGKVPRFAGHFSSADEMNEILVAKGAGTRTAPLRAEERSAMTSQTAAEPLPFGVRLMGGAAIALVIALLGGYFWAYQFSAPKDLAVINDSIEMRTLQGEYDGEKARLENKKRAEDEGRKKMAAFLQGGGLSDRSYEFLDCDRSTPENDSMCLELRKQPGRWIRNAGKSKTAAPSVAQTIPPPTDYDSKLSDLDIKFEIDKKKIVADARGADSRSKFYQTFVLLFLGLAGLNLARLSFSPKK